MLPIQQFFIEKISENRLTKTDLAKAINSENISDGQKTLNCFFKSAEPDFDTAKTIASALCMTDEEFEDLWYQTKDQAIRRKIKARIRNEKLQLEEVNAA